MKVDNSWQLHILTSLWFYVAVLWHCGLVCVLRERHIETFYCLFCMTFQIWKIEHIAMILPLDWNCAGFSAKRFLVVAVHPPATRGYCWLYVPPLRARRRLVSGSFLPNLTRLLNPWFMGPRRVDNHFHQYVHNLFRRKKNKTKLCHASLSTVTVHQLPLVPHRNFTPAWAHLADYDISGFAVLRRFPVCSLSFVFLIWIKRFCW